MLLPALVCMLLGCQKPATHQSGQDRVRQQPAQAAQLAQAFESTHVSRSGLHRTLIEQMGSPKPRSAGFRKGVALGLFVSQDASEKSARAIYSRLLDEIVAVGATDLSLVARWVQPDFTSSKIAPKQGVTVSDEMLEWVLEEASRRNLRVFLMPYIFLEKRTQGIWRGTIEPKDLNLWWRNYTKFIVHYAAIAKAHEVSMFSVGSELLSREPEEERWRKLIARVREHYSGALTYSSNWDHFEVPAFWDALDVMGVTAYQELSKKRRPTLDDLINGWRLFALRLQRWSAEHNMRVVFTEIGYPSHQKGAAFPWDYTSNAKPDAWIQAMCYRAMFDVWNASDVLGGLYIWNWFGPQGAHHSDYTPRGKPAHKILKRWYTGATLP